MASFLPDTTCMVALVCGWHPDHPRSSAEIRRRLSQGQELVVAAPALVEAFAVLTRLPPPHRVVAAEALFLLESNFMSDRRLVSLSESAYKSLLRDSAGLGIAGGKVYDAVIAECAMQAGVDALLTLNDRHFLDVARDRLRVIVPGQQNP
jgi:predicted nucleic acid-binding protein